MDFKVVSFSLGAKLKELREERGYTFPELIEALDERYGLKITDDSLKAYEISNDFHSKADRTPNLKMKVETLFCLADLYGVSMDYLLGKDPISSGDPEKRAAEKYTGLCESSLTALHQLLRLANRDQYPQHVIDEITAAVKQATENWDYRKSRIVEDIKNAPETLKYLDMYNNLDDYEATLKTQLDYYDDANALRDRIVEEEDFVKTQHSISAKMALDGLNALLTSENPEYLFSLIGRYLLSEEPARYDETVLFSLKDNRRYETTMQTAVVAATLIEIEHQLQNLRAASVKTYQISRNA